MSTVIDPKATLPHTDETYRYGWREIITKNLDGSTKVTRIPLTLEDALHPQLGDVMPENSLHVWIRTYLACVFDERLAGDPTALVLSDVLIYWDVPDLKQHGPDVCAIFGVKKRKRVSTSFHVVEEQTRPRLIVEIVSPDTRDNDVDKKLVQYHQARVPWYIIVDCPTHDAPLQLRGYQWSAAQYVEMPKDARGRLWLEPLGIWLGTDGDTVICYDGATDEELGDYKTIKHDMLTAKLKSEVEATRAEAEKARADTEKARAEAEKLRAEAEKARAEAEKARAEAEKARAEAAERHSRELEAELARLRAHHTDGPKETE